MLFCEEQNINPLFIKRSSEIFNELQINGRQADTDENDTPVDYTTDDEGSEDTGAPADDTPEDAPEDYTVPDEGEVSAGTDASAGDTQPADMDTTGGEEGTPIDYTADTDTGDDVGGGDEGTNPTDMEGTANMGGEEEPPADYTDDAGSGDTGGDEGGENVDDVGGDTGGGDEGSGEGDTTGGDTGGGEGDDEIDQLEDDILGDLSDEQMMIKDKELKTNFSNLYDVIIDIEERINNVSKDADMIKPMEFISNKLSDLSTQVSDYLSYTYETKSYTENMVMYRMFLTVLEQINSILDNIRPNNSSK